MAEWELAQTNPGEQLAQLHFFSMKTQQADGEIEFRIVVREHVIGEDQSMRFFAEADKQTNQHTAAFTPCGWGSTLLKALSECIRAIHRFPYEGPMPAAGVSESSD
jgi:hypothetical protein